MDAFNLAATLTLDDTAYTAGLVNAEAKAMAGGSGIGRALSNAGKLAGMALVGATAATAAFGASSVKTGMEFDDAMSQVQATMLKTSEEMENEVGSVDTAFGHFEGNLREFAQFLGQNTAFSATQAAEALNYMALAGYSTQESLDMLPNVLSLAAAGNFDLAKASDMVTDAATAFGLSVEENGPRITQMVDEMAKTASVTNTSVEQLGDAFLVVGGLAQDLNGGFVTLADGTQASVDGIQEMEIALGAMASAGIKGSEAGTHMRNMLLKLSAPTEEGAKTFDALGVSVFDAQGQMRSLGDIFEDLSSSMGNLTQQEKLEAISNIFNVRDVASAEALLSAVGQDWDKIGAEILQAEGAAAEMASIQLDNLQGDVTLFKSALEGAKIAISDQLTPSLREFVQFGTDGLSNLTTAFQENGLAGAMEVFGTLLSDGLNMIIESLPQFVGAGMSLLGALGQGLLDNLPVIVDSAVQVIQMLVEGLISALPQLVEGGMQILIGLGSGITQMLPTLIPTIVDVVLSIVDALIDNVDLVVEGAIALVESLAQGLITALPRLINKVPSLIIKLVSAIRKNLPQVIQSGIQIILMLIDGIVKALPQLVAAIPHVINSVVKALSTTLPMLIEGIIQLVVGIVEALPEIITTLVEALPTIIEAVVNGLITALPLLIAGAIQLVIELVKHLPEIILALIEAIPVILTSIVDAFGPIGDMIGEVFLQAFNGVKDIWDALVGFFQEIWDGIVDVFHDVADWFKERFEESQQNIRDSWAAIIDFFSEIWDGIVGVFASVANWFKERFEESQQNIRDSWDAIIDFFSGIWDGIVDVFDGVVDWFRGRFEETYDQITGAFDGIGNFFSGVWEEIKSFFDFSDAWTWGQDLIDNFVGGIRSMWNTLTGAVSDAASIVVDFLGFSEPERGPLSNFHTYAPDMMTLFAQGVRENEDMVTRQIAESFDFRDLIGGDYDFNANIGVNEDVERRRSRFDDAEPAGDEITINIYASDNQNEKEIARQVQRQLVMWENQRRAAYA